MIYRNGALQIYIDTPQNLHTFQLPYVGYKLLYYGLIFIPLGSLLGLILMVLQGSPRVQFGLVFSGLFGPPLLLEGLLVNMTPRSLALENLGLSLGFMIFGLWLMYKSLDTWLKGDFRLNHRKVSAY